MIIILLILILPIVVVILVVVVIVMVIVMMVMTSVVSVMTLLQLPGTAFNSANHLLDVLSLLEPHTPPLDASCGSWLFSSLQEP